MRKFWTRRQDRIHYLGRCIQKVPPTMHISNHSQMLTMSKKITITPTTTTTTSRLSKPSFQSILLGNAIGRNRLVSPAPALMQCVRRPRFKVALRVSTTTSLSLSLLTTLVLPYWYLLPRYALWVRVPSSKKARNHLYQEHFLDMNTCTLHNCKWDKWRIIPRKRRVILSFRAALWELRIRWWTGTTLTFRRWQASSSSTNPHAHRAD